MQVKSLSIVFPVFNEESTIEEIIKRVEEVELPNITKELVIVDDFSTDKTRQILQKYKDKKNFNIIFKEKNEGKSSAVKKGLMSSTGDLVIIQDADLEYDPEDYNKLIQPFLKADAEAAYGSRFKGSGPHRMIYFRNMIANRFLTFLSNLFTGYNLTDMETCYKMFKGDIIREIAPTLTATRFGFEPEVTAKIAKRKVKLYEVGISYYGRTTEEGKKIRFWDGLKAIWEIFKYNMR